MSIPLTVASRTPEVQSLQGFLRREDSVMHHRLPLVTILMPIRNEVDFIERSLGSVLAQDYPPELLEVIVIDGVSNDGTQQVVRRIIDRVQTPEPAKRPEVRIIFLENPARIVPAALNIGLKNASGEIVIRIDGHCEIADDYVSRCVHALMTSDAECVGGPISTLGKTLTARAIALAQSSWFGVGGVAFRRTADTPRNVDTVAFGAYRRAVFERIGNFDEDMVRDQDDELNYRLIHSGGKILLDPSIHSTYYNRATLYRLWRQYFEYGYWKVRVMHKHPRQMRARQFAPALFMVAVFGGVIPSLLSTVAAETWFGILALYAIATLVFSVAVGKRHGWRYAPLVGLSCVALHSSYGLGFLLGLIRFALSPSQRLNRKRDR